MWLNNIYPKLTKILRELCRDDTLVATPELKFVDLPGWRPMLYARIMGRVEEEFDIDIITEMEGRGFMTNLSQLARLIESKL